MARLTRRICSSVPRTIKRALICQILFALFIFFILTYSYGGLIKKRWQKMALPIMRAQNAGGVRPDVCPCEYFTDVHGDAGNVTWTSAYKEADVTKALADNFHMFRADFIQTHPRSFRSLVGYDKGKAISLKEWIDWIVPYQRGFLLFFKNITDVKSALDTLQEIKNTLHVPVWLGANVLKGPNTDRAPAIKAKDFLKLCKDKFPHSTLLLGWTSAPPEGNPNKRGYTWAEVIEMHDLILSHDLRQPVVISVRSVLTVHSVPQIRWLSDTIDSYIYVWDEMMDGAPLLDIMYLRYTLPRSDVYFGLSDRHKETFPRHRNKPGGYLDRATQQRAQRRLFSEEWKQFIYGVNSRLLLGTGSAVMSGEGAFLVRKLNSVITSTDPVSITGVVHFEPRGTAKIGPGDGIEIFLRTQNPDDMNRLKGVKCFMGAQGVIKIESHNIINVDLKKEGKVTPSYFGLCYRFIILDSGSTISIHVKVPPNCAQILSTEESDRATVLMQTLNKISEDDYRIVVRTSSQNLHGIVEELIIQ